MDGRAEDMRGSDEREPVSPCAREALMLQMQIVAATEATDKLL